MKSEVLGIGGLQMLLTTRVFGGAAWARRRRAGASAIVLGGALAMASTAIVMRQLREQLELPRTHARLAVGHPAVPGSCVRAAARRSRRPISAGDAAPGSVWLLGMVGRAVVALLLVLVVGRWLLRPLFHEIARHRSTETFTLTVLFVVLAARGRRTRSGLSMALGGFLAGMLLAETEFRHQTEAVIKPFHDILLGLVLRLGRHAARPAAAADRSSRSCCCCSSVLLLVKALIVTLIVRQFVHNPRKALRTGIVVSMGGEFGFALLTLLLSVRSLDTEHRAGAADGDGAQHAARAAARALQRAHRGPHPAARGHASRRPSHSKRLRRANSRGASTSSSAASAVSARTWPACSSSAVSNTSRSISIRIVCAMRARQAIRSCTATRRIPRCCAHSASITRAWS